MSPLFGEPELRRVRAGRGVSEAKVKRATVRTTPSPRGPLAAQLARPLDGQHCLKGELREIRPWHSP